MHERIDAPHKPQGIPVTEAARLLGVAPSTVRRRIREGTLEGIRELRPQGSSWRVILPSGASEQRPRAGSATADGASYAPPQEDEHATAGATPRATARPTTSEPVPASLVLAALVDALGTAHQLAERHAGTI